MLQCDTFCLYHVESVLQQGHLMVQVVQSLRSCFLYDTVSFLDEVAFHRLLPLLVTQLAAQPPTSVSTLLVQQQADTAAATEAAAASADPFGDATVSALVQMAITVNNDALWKSLNHQVRVHLLAFFAHVVIS